MAKKTESKHISKNEWKEIRKALAHLNLAQASRFVPRSAQKEAVPNLVKYAEAWSFPGYQLCQFPSSVECVSKGALAPETAEDDVLAVPRALGCG